MGALNFKVTPEEQQAIRKAINQVNIEGDRYEATFGQELMQDTPEKA